MHRPMEENMTLNMTLKTQAMEEKIETFNFEVKHFCVSEDSMF
jgi:hypothetical protein